MLLHPSNNNSLINDYSTDSINDYYLKVLMTVDVVQYRVS